MIPSRVVGHGAGGRIYTYSGGGTPAGRRSRTRSQSVFRTIMCPPSDRRPWTSVTYRPPTIPTHSTMYTLCPRPTPAPGRTPVRNPRMPGGWAPADPLLHTPIALFLTPPASLCNCTARACLPVSPRGGILHSGPNPGKQNLYIPPHGTHLVGWGGGVRTGCASTVPSDAAVALPPQHRRTVGPCVSLATHSCHHADRRGRLRQMLQSGRGPLLRPYRPRDTTSWVG